MKPEKKGYYANFYEANNGAIRMGGLHNSRVKADLNAGAGRRIACKKIVEGEFDD